MTGILTLVVALGPLICAGTRNEAMGAARSAPARPNILLIVADDLGYNDLGAFGSEIRTPSIDRLAATGTVFTSYYTAPLCAPTRAMLLSGTDHHRAGEGIMGQAVTGTPGYEGYLNRRVVSLATRLKAVGYHTYMSGKWHLGDEEDQSPTSRGGFERSFALLGRAGDHYGMKAATGMASQYRDDGKLIDELPKDFYSTIAYTDKMLGYLKSNERDGKPFFAYLAYTAPHWPVQAPDADIEKQRGRYDAGYEVLRQQRFAAWKAKGFAPEDAQMPNLPPDYRPWSSLSAEEQAKSARTMEVYAAMVERMDSEIGRVLQYLEQSGQLANTLIMFQSDNGAEGTEGMVPRSNADRSLASIGRPGSWDVIGRGWAEAGSVPFFMQKYSTAEGGIRVPAIVSAPQLGVAAGRRSDALLIASDVAPTFLELAGADPSRPVKQRDALPITGRSFVKLLRGDDSGKRGTTDVVGWEHRGHAAIRKGDWKLVWTSQDPEMGPPGGMPPRGGPPLGRPSGAPPSPGSGIGPGGPGAGNGPPPTGPAGGPPALGVPISHASIDAGTPAGAPVGTGGPWRLFNIRNDPAELHDLSGQHPQIVKELMAEWDRYVADNGVIVKRGDDAK